MPLVTWRPRSIQQPWGLSGFRQENYILLVTRLLLVENGVHLSMADA